MGDQFELAALAVLSRAPQTIELHPPSNPRFIEQPWRAHEPFYRGRNWKKRNPNAAKQAAAKRARKITRRTRA